MNKCLEITMASNIKYVNKKIFCRCWSRWIVSLFGRWLRWSLKELFKHIFTNAGVPLLWQYILNIARIFLYWYCSLIITNTDIGFINILICTGSPCLCIWISKRQCLSSVERYDPDADEWTKVADMTTRRSGAGVGVIDGLLYAVGGHDGPTVRKSAEVFHPQVGKNFILWLKVTFSFRKTNGYRFRTCFIEDEMQVCFDTSTIPYDMWTISHIIWYSLWYGYMV